MILGTNSSFRFNLRDIVPKIVNIQSVLEGDGAAFDLLDMSRMYQDIDGTVPAGRAGDTVRRVESYVEGIYLVDREGNGATVEIFNEVPVLRFSGTLFELEGAETKLPKPNLAHGTMSATASTLYWYNRPGSGYGPRKWGAIVRDSQYRAFHNNGSITVIGVPEWNTYHDVYWNRTDLRATVDGVIYPINSSSASNPEVYSDEDGGFRLGGYNGTTTESYTGIVTYFVISGTPLNEPNLREFIQKKREYLGL